MKTHLLRAILSVLTFIILAFPFPTDIGRAQAETPNAQETAIAYVSKKYSLSPERLIVYDTFLQEDKATQTSASVVIMSDNFSGMAYKVAVDPSSNVMEWTDYSTILNNNFRKKYGKLSPSLYDLLHTKTSDEQITVALWLKCDPTAATRSVVSQYPDAHLSGTKPTKETDLEKYKTIKQELNNAIKTAVKSSQDPVLEYISSKGFPVTFASKLAPVVFTELPKSLILLLQDRDDVSYVYQIEDEIIPALDLAERVVHTPRQGNYAFTGADIKVAILEREGIDLKNDYLPHPPSQNYCNPPPEHEPFLYNPPAYQGGHATKVAGVIAMVYPDRQNPQYLGIAPDVILLSANSKGAYDTAYWEDVCDWALDPLLDHNAEVLNVSWVKTATGMTTLDAYMDWVALHWGTTIVVSAGNTGPEGEIHSPALAYNVITVGNFDDHGTTVWTDDDMHVSSTSVEPTTQGDREKPEVAAPGFPPIVTTTAYTASPPTGYTYPLKAVGGTSISAPIVSGEAARLMEQAPLLKERPEALKAIIMASAVNDVDPGSNERVAVGGISIEDAHAIVYDSTWSDGTFFEGGDPVDTRQFYAQAGDRVQVALSWLARWDSHDVIYPDYFAVTDIDLQVLSPIGSYVESISIRNNYEIVKFTAPVSGTYTIRLMVSPSSMHQDESYALAWRVKTPPSVSTDAATSVTLSSAIINGNLTSLGSMSNVSVFFEWGPTIAYGSSELGFPSSLSSIGSFDAALSGLSPNMTYHFRAKAIGDRATSYGADQWFTTSGGTPPHFLSGWGYRKKITINSASALTNYQMMVSVYKGTGTDSVNSVFLNNHCQDDFDDIRFTRADGTTLLDYWQESYAAGSSSVFWVEFDQIQSGSSTFYLYYGNAGATSTSNGDSTFIFFDDFSGSYPGGKWTGDTGFGAVSNNVFTMSGNTGGAEAQIYSATLGPTVNIAYRSRLRSYPVLNNFGLQWNTVARFDYTASAGLGYWAGGSYHQVISNWAAGNYRTYDITMDTGGVSHFYQDGTGVQNSPVSAAPATNRVKFGMTTTSVQTAIDCDWVLLRNYVSTNQPAWGSWGAETPTPPPFLSGWSYRKQITINSASALANYQMMVSVYKGTGADSGNSVYLNNHCRDDFGDIRFTKADGTTLLDHWQESYAAGSSSVFWVEFDQVQPGSNAFYVYYSNAGAASASNGDSAFIFFDDFSGAFPGAKWGVDTSYGSVSNDVFTMSGNTGGAEAQIYSATEGPAANTAYRARLCSYAVPNSFGLQGNSVARFEYNSGTYLGYWANGGYHPVVSNWGTGNYHTFDITMDAGGVCHFYQDGTGAQNSPVTATPATNRVKFGMTTTSVQTAIACDWVLLRNYSSTEPTWGIWGGETSP